jgi:hypothetical protein
MLGERVKRHDSVHLGIRRGDFFGACPVPASTKNEKATDVVAYRKCLILLVRLERAKGFEPSTPTLAMVCLDEYANNINDL